MARPIERFEGPGLMYLYRGERATIERPERRKANVAVWWSTSAQAWVPYPRRRKTDERRDPHRRGYRYTSSYDPRIQVLERRKS